MWTDDLSGKRITVMGLGRFGGGVGVVRYLVAQGADVLVTDLGGAKTLAQSVASLQGLPVSFRLGEHNVSDFTTCQGVVANPAVRPDNRFLRAAHAANIPITSEIRLLAGRLPSRRRTIGITGTAGKSTVTAMIGHLLNKTRPQHHANVWVGGNLGGSLLQHVEQIQPNDWVVLELSSFMLEGLSHDRWSPHVAVLTNLSPNHLDWHDTLEAYTRAKHAIFDFQVAGDVALETAEPAEADLLIPGEHNQINAGFALSVVHHLGVVAEGQLLADFPGLPHRLEYVGTFQGVRCYNDSKCTTPQAAALALECFPNQTVHVILGGYDKASDLIPLAHLAQERCKGVYTLGATGAAIAAVTGRDCGTLDVAVRQAMAHAKPGEVLLLSPACASWDQFENYEQRGQQFITLLKNLAGG